MITIKGTTKNPGIAIAAGAVIDAKSGINAVSPALLQEGINALRRQLHPNDYPEAVIACDMLAIGVSVKIPGVNTIAIAAESDADVPGMNIDVPCVVGLPNLLMSITHGDIIIVDGDRGVVHIDPDPQTIVSYQHIIEEAHPQLVFVLEPEEFVTHTNTGQEVSVYAWVANESDLDTALIQGADGLVVHAWPGAYEDVIHRAAGMPVAFAEGGAEEDLVRASMRYAAPQQVSVLFPQPEFETLSADMVKIATMLARELEIDESEGLWINLGALTREPDAHDLSLTHQLIDLHESSLLDTEPSEITQRLGLQPNSKAQRETILLAGSHVDVLLVLVAAGATRIAVAAGSVAKAKRVIAEMEPSGEIRLD